MQKTQYFFSPQPQQTNRKKRVQICTRKHNFEVQTNVYSFEYKSVLEINTDYYAGKSAVFAKFHEFL